MIRFLDKVGFAQLSSMNEIFDLTPTAFEYFSKYLLENEEYSNVRVRKKTGRYHADGGVDLEATRDGNIVYVQCKKWRGSFRGGFMPIDNIRALNGCMSRDGVSEGVFISTLPFGKQAKSEAKQMHIRLVGPNDIQSIMGRLNVSSSRKDFMIRNLITFSNKQSKGIIKLALGLIVIFLG